MVCKDTNNRQFQRFAVETTGYLCRRNYTVREAVATGNISCGGAFLRTENYSLEQDEKVCLEFGTETGGKLRLIGTIIWSNHYPVGSIGRDVVDRGVGVRFHDINEALFHGWLKRVHVVDQTPSH